MQPSVEKLRHGECHESWSVYPSRFQRGQLQGVTEGRSGGRLEIAGRIGKILQSDSYAAYTELKAVRLHLAVGGVRGSDLSS